MANWCMITRGGGDNVSSSSHIQANIKYNRSRDNIMLRPTKGEGAEIRQAAAAAGKSVQAYILDVLSDARATQGNR